MAKVELGRGAFVTRSSSGQLWLPPMSNSANCMGLQGVRRLIVCNRFIALKGGQTWIQYGAYYVLEAIRLRVSNQSWGERHDIRPEAPKFNCSVRKKYGVSGLFESLEKRLWEVRVAGPNYREGLKPGGRRSAKVAAVEVVTIQ